mgnify:CR=1 FL=1
MSENKDERRGRSYHPNDFVPDVRDGLTRIERGVINCIHELQQENGGRKVPTVLLWGELIDRGYDLTRDDLNKILAKLGAMDKNQEND